MLQFCGISNLNQFIGTVEGHFFVGLSRYICACGLLCLRSLEGAGQRQFRENAMRME